jgi:hypothetical protein
VPVVGRIVVAAVVGVDNAKGSAMSKRTKTPEYAHEEAATIIIDLLPESDQTVIYNYIHELDARISDLEEESEAIEAEDLTEAIDAFCNVVDRPVGTLKFNIPDTAEKDRAVRRLFDAIDRPI